jgi:hypothetical protein
MVELAGPGGHKKKRETREREKEESDLFGRFSSISPNASFYIRSLFFKIQLLVHIPSFKASGF